MWILTPSGFFSVVQKEGDALLSVRARVRTDLEELMQSYLPNILPIQEGGHTDYPYRIFVDHSTWAAALTRIARDIDYPNFKRAVKSNQGPIRSKIYGNVWRELYALQERCDQR